VNTLLLSPPSPPPVCPPSPVEALVGRVRPLPVADVSGLAQAAALPAAPEVPEASSPVSPVPSVPTSELRSRVAQLPPLPEVLLATVATLDRGNARLGDVAELLQRDQALTARVLRLANSAFYGVPGRVASVHDAISLIGLRSLRSLVATAALTQQVPLPRDSSFETGVFWRHTVAVAFAARFLAAAHALDEEMAYTAGLLHDVGRLALAAHFPQAHTALVQAIRTAGHGGRALERQLLGTDHAEVGAIVAEHWHLPNPVVVRWATATPSARNRPVCWPAPGSAWAWNGCPSKRSSRRWTAPSLPPAPPLDCETRHEHRTAGTPLHARQQRCFGPEPPALAGAAAADAVRAPGQHRAAGRRRGP
jgi:putative nucleotidyltransferase with HDIG domain